MSIPIAEVNVEAVAIFALVVGITLAITYWASKRTRDATTFWAAGRGITGVQNGFAIAGDYMSAASFLGIAGLIFLFGFDGFLYSVGFLVAFLIVLFLLSERMRNSGKFTIADVLSFRLNERPARTAAALGTLSVVAFYLIAQMVGAGALIQALVGINFNLAVLLTGGFMLIYVIFGGMLATTWVQIIKAVLLMSDDRADAVRARKDELEPDRSVQPRRGAVRGRRRVPVARAELRQPDRHDLARTRASARDGGTAAHPDAVLHRSRRSLGAPLGVLGGGVGRVVLRHDHGPRLRRACAARRGGRNGCRRRGGQPRRAAARPDGRGWGGHGRRRRLPGDHRGGRVRDHPRGRRRARRARLPTTCP